MSNTPSNTGTHGWCLDPTHITNCTYDCPAPDTPTNSELDEIIFRCFDQGVYWGKLAYSDGGERPDKPDDGIDRTQANKLIQALINKQVIEALAQQREDIRSRLLGKKELLAQVVYDDPMEVDEVEAVSTGQITKILNSYKEK